jgi:class 3 adenylate cyclase/tetratricopeptide (TPR) repeat protein
VLFADVKGSMELAEQVDAEEWHVILDRFFQILADGVHRFEGTVNQYTGDGIMALFGAPIAHEDHAQRACYAALRIRDALSRFAEELRGEHGIEFGTRIGVNSGEVIVGKIGDDLRMDYTAQGQTVGLAARVEEIAEPGCIYLSEHAARLVEGFFQLRELGPSRLRGISQPLCVAELEGIGGLRTRFDFARARGLSRFVGRAEEQATLDVALQRAAEGDGQVIGVVGEAGVGKSRLSAEFVVRCRAKKIPVYEAHCPAHGRTVPFLPLLELLRSYFGISADDDEREVRGKIAGIVLPLDESFHEPLPLLLDFLGVADPEQPVPMMDPEARQRRLYRLVCGLIRARSAREPALLLVDDVHWIDPGSDAFLAQLVEAVSGTRALLLVNFRPEYRAGWMSHSGYRQLPLVPLGPGEVRELLRSLLGADPSLSALPDLLQERTRGNPFFIEEVVQSLVESHSLAGERGSYRLTKPLEQLAIPQQVQSVLAARIDRLPERDKHVLQTAAVIGKEFAEPVLESVADLRQGELADALHMLERGEFVRAQALYPVAVYAFKHPLTQEVAYASQLAQRRAALHRAVADAITELHGEPLDAQAAFLAHHREAAGEKLEAARCHARAAGWVVQRDREAARSHWLNVRRLLAQLEDSAETLFLDLLACGQVTMQGYLLGAPAQEIEALFAEGKLLAERIPDPRPRSLLQIGYAGYVGLSAGDVRRFVSAQREAVRLAEASGDPGHRLAAGAALGNALALAGDPNGSLEVLDRCLAERPEDPLAGREINGMSPWIYAVTIRFWPLSELGRLGEAAETIRRGIELAREHGEHGLVSLGLTARVIHDEWSGESATTLATARQSLEIAERMGVPMILASATFSFGDALRMEGRCQEALEAYQEALALIRARRVGLVWEPTIASGQALACSALGEHETAIGHARSALEDAVAGGNRRAENSALLALARVLLATGDSTLRDEVERVLERAEACCRKTGMRVHLPALLEVRAALAERRGRLRRARQTLREAHRLYTEMGAHGHIERMARDLEELSSRIGE